MKRRIESLISRKGYDGYDSFVKGMEKDNTLLRTFVSYLTINVSQFYRNPQQWEKFETRIIPYLRKTFGDNLTIWSAACSTGDEPYTIAMILSKYISTDKFKIIATDIDDDVLEYAQTGIYPAKCMSDLPKEYIEKNFKKLDNNNYQVLDGIKKTVQFKKHNLLKDQYFKNVNMIVCRNVVIYFTDQAKDYVYNNFHNSIADNGILFIGSTEQIMHAKDIGFETKEPFFYQKIKK